jgi:hypothetical protein
LYEALLDYQARERRFGKTSDQVKAWFPLANSRTWIDY